MRLLEWLLLYFIVGFIALGFEKKMTGQLHAQDWEFYATGFCLFIVFALPGFIYRHDFLHHLQRWKRRRLKWAFSQKIVVWPRLLCFIFLLTMSYKIRKNRVIGHFIGVEILNSPHIVPSRWMILRLFEQEVQIRGIKTGSLVSATLKNHTAMRVSAGHNIGDVFFSWVLHFLDKQKRSASPLKGEITTQHSLYSHP